MDWRLLIGASLAPLQVVDLAFLTKNAIAFGAELRSIAILGTST